jgi:hypothetical protein
MVWIASALRLSAASRDSGASRFIAPIALATLALTVFLALEAEAWAALYLWLGALPDWHTAMLYSLGAITSYGGSKFYLADRWGLLGPIEAVNGLMLFGLTTAFLFTAMHNLWPLRRN